MFGGSSNNNNKRRSFFLFGSDSKVATAPIKTIEKGIKGTVLPNNNKSTVQKHHDSVSATHSSSNNKPLSRSPLMNFGNGSTFEGESKTKVHSQRPQTQTPSSQRKLKKEDIFMSNDIARDSSVYSTPPSEINEQNLPLVALQNGTAPVPPRSRARRPPPPTLDMDALTRSYEPSSRLSSVGTVDPVSDTTPIVEEAPALVPLNPYENIIESSSEDEHPINVVDEDEPVEIEPPRNEVKIINIPRDENLENLDTNAKQHRRQRSEAESLVDDIDVYIKEYKENSQSVEDLLALDCLNDKNIISSPEVEQSLYSGPHNDPNMKIDIRPIKTNFNHLIIDDEFSPESSLLYVSPLDVGHLSASDSAKQRQFSRNTLTITNIASNESSSSNDKSDSSDSSNDSDESSSASNFSFSNSVDDGDDSSAEVETEDNSEASFVKAPKEDMDSSDLIRKKSFQLVLDKTKTLTPSESFSPNQNTDGVMRESSSRYENETFKEEITNVSTDDYMIETSGDMVPQDTEPRKTFRIANEDHPTFYIKDDNSIIDNDTSTMQSTETEIDKSQISNDSTYEKGVDMGVVDSQDILPPDLSTFTSNESSLNGPAPQRTLNNSPDNTTLTSGEKSLRSVQSMSGNSMKSAERTSKLVSGYVEELRLKYFQTSNFLQAPPNLPLALKQKNNLIKPKNIKVKIRTNTKQVGIKHGKVKQKLLSFETSTADNKDLSLKKEKNNAAVDHTKEFHNFFNREGSQAGGSKAEDNVFDSDSDYMADIPGDEAYDSDDILAPLREKKGSHNTVSRNSTVVSYYTRSKNRMRESDGALPGLPTNVSIDKYKTKEVGSRTSSIKGGRTRSDSMASVSTQLLTSKVSGSVGLHVANPDSDSD